MKESTCAGWFICELSEEKQRQVKRERGLGKSSALSGQPFARYGMDGFGNSVTIF